jgi:hypothetical protein
MLISLLQVNASKMPYLLTQIKGVFHGGARGKHPDDLLVNLVLPFYLTPLFNLNFIIPDQLPLMPVQPPAFSKLSFETITR